MAVDLTKNTRILLTVSHALRREIAVVRRDRRITESEAIRRLVMSGLEVYARAADQRQRHPRDANAVTASAGLPASILAIE
jgi:hypothetical protein